MIASVPRPAARAGSAAPPARRGASDRPCLREFVGVLGWVHVVVGLAARWDAPPERLFGGVWHLPRALGLAIKSFDAWVLADEVAMSTIVGHTVDRQRDMESLRDPKLICKGIFLTFFLKGYSLFYNEK